MTKKKNKSSSSKNSAQSKVGRNVSILATVVVVILAVFYIATGNDLLGLFNPSEETAESAETSGIGGDW